MLAKPGNLLQVGISCSKSGTLHNSTSGILTFLTNRLVFRTNLGLKFCYTIICHIGVETVQQLSKILRKIILRKNVFV